MNRGWPGATLLLLASGYALASGCGDVTGDLIVRDTPAEVACTSDVDCPAELARCELVTTTCVACLDDDDCASGQRCSLPANVCINRCVEGTCNRQSPVCDLETGVCRACSDDDDCGDSTPFCHASGACVACSVNADCRGDAEDMVFCSTAGRCVECLQPGHCEDPGEVCNEILGECVTPCSTTLPCNSDDDPICDEDLGACVECTMDSDCEPGELCRGSECVN